MNLSIVIVTYKGERFIGRCLDSVFRQEIVDAEVIVVDNGSRDGTAATIKQRYPQVVLIENKENKGASAGRNQAIEIAKSPWILTMDCDTVLSSDFLVQARKILLNLPGNVGIIQPKILKTDRKTVFTCGIYLSFLFRPYEIGRGKMDVGQYRDPRSIFGACSAAALYRMDMLGAIKDERGYFDRNMFFLFEDVDLAWRAQARGWRALFCPQIECFHDGGSTFADKKIRQYLSWRNRKLFLQKIKIDVFKSLVLGLVYDLPRACLMFLTNPYVRFAIESKYGLRLFFRSIPFSKSGDCNLLSEGKLSIR